MNEEDVSIRITRRDKKGRRIFGTSFTKDNEFVNDKSCMFRTERILKRSSIIERLSPQDSQESQPEETEKTEQRTRFFKARRFDRDGAIIWVVQVDRERAETVDTVLSDLSEYLTHPTEEE